MNLYQDKELYLDFCSYQAAKYACEHWHYSAAIPTPPLVLFGVWEHLSFVGSIIYSRGASPSLHRPYGLEKTEICELTRVAMRSHESFISRMIAITLRMLKKENPGLRLVISFADPNQEHLGGIYQAGNWIYTGQTQGSKEYIDSNGKRYHSRQVSEKGWNVQYGCFRRVPKPSSLFEISLEGKYRYLYPLDKVIRRQVGKLSLPYPKRSPKQTEADDQLAQAGQNRPGRSNNIEVVAND